NAKLLTTKNAPSTEDASGDVQTNRGLSRAAASAEKEVHETQAELDGLYKRLRTASEKDRQQLQSTIDEVQSELNLAQTRSETFRSILQFVNEGAEGSTKATLLAQIEELQKSIPELEPEAKATPTQTSASQPSSAQSAAMTQTANREPPSGILDL